MSPRAHFASIAVKLVFFSSILLLWHLLTWGRETHLMPSPSQVAQSFRELLEDGRLWTSIRLSMQRMFLGYGISVVGGLIFGVLAARSWLFKETFGSGVLALQSLPSICWLPFALIWFGLDDRAVLAVIILGALFSIAVATESAIRNVPPIYLKVGQVLGARRLVFARDILFFAALPELLSGLKLGWTFAWRSLMAAELLRQDIFGIGHLLETSRSLNDVAGMMAAILTILVIGLLVDGYVFGSLEHHVRRRYGLEK